MLSRRPSPSRLLSSSHSAFLPSISSLTSIPDPSYPSYSSYPPLHHPFPSSLPPPPSSATHPSSTITPSGRPPPKTARRQSKLNNLDRRRICEYAAAHPKSTQEDIALQWGIDRSSVSKILKYREKWLSISPTARAAKVIKHRGGRFPQLEIEVIRRCKSIALHGSFLGDRIIKDLALQVSNEIGLGEGAFKASNGWLDAFKERAQIKAGRFLDPSLLHLPSPSNHLHHSHYSPTCFSSSSTLPTTTTTTTHPLSHSPSPSSALLPSFDPSVTPLLTCSRPTTSNPTLLALPDQQHGPHHVDDDDDVEEDEDDDVEEDDDDVEEDEDDVEEDEETEEEEDDDDDDVNLNVHDGQERFEQDQLDLQSSHSTHHHYKSSSSSLSPHHHQLYSVATAVRKPTRDQVDLPCTTPPLSSPNSSTTGEGQPTKPRLRSPLPPQSDAMEGVEEYETHAHDTSPGETVVLRPSSSHLPPPPPSSTAPLTTQQVPRYDYYRSDLRHQTSSSHSRSSSVSSSLFDAFPPPPSTARRTFPSLRHALSHPALLSSTGPPTTGQSSPYYYHPYASPGSAPPTHQVHPRLPPTVSTASLYPLPHQPRSAGPELAPVCPSRAGRLIRPLSAEQQQLQNLDCTSSIWPSSGSGGSASNGSSSAGGGSRCGRAVGFDEALGALETVMKFLQEQPTCFATPRDYMVVGELFGRMKEKKQELIAGATVMGGIGMMKLNSSSSNLNTPPVGSSSSLSRHPSSQTLSLVLEHQHQPSPARISTPIRSYAPAAIKEPSSNTETTCGADNLVGGARELMEH